jgi:hypothetical protein
MRAPRTQHEKLDGSSLGDCALGTLTSRSSLGRIRHCSINGAPFFRLTAVNHYPDNDCVESDIHEPER